MQKFSVLAFMASVIISACSPALSPMDQLKVDIQSIIGASPGTYAVALQDLKDSSIQLLINEKVVFHAASTMKTPVMMELFKQSREGKLSMEEELPVKNEFISIVDGSTFSMDIGEDSDEMLYEKIGEKVKIYDLMYNMIIHSSNLATNLLIEKVDAQNVTQTLRDMGAMDIKVLRGVEDIKAYRKGLSNTTTAYDLMLIYEQLGKGTFLDKSSCQRMINILLDQEHNDLIPANLPTEVKVAHKTGFITKILHDSGIVFLPDGRQYVLVILSKEWDKEETAQKTIANISKRIYDFYITNP
ncbi:MAG: serine hydrolase [Saprospiraceae bacterium]|nr:serine hydrolase [Saprospiraceae bacterium]MCB9322614.1 serine hydrolase [Lewinellaceae bacterium]